MEKQKKNKEFNALQNLESLSKKAKATGFSEKFFLESEKEYTALCKLLELDFKQCCLFSVLLKLNLENENAHIHSVCEYTNCSPFYLLSFQSDFDVLIEKGYINKESSGGRRRKCKTYDIELKYMVNEDIVNKLIKNNFIYEENNEELNAVDFLIEVNQIVEDRYYDSGKFSDMNGKIDKLKDKYQNCLAVKAASQFLLNAEEEVIAYLICYATIDNGEIGLNDLLDKVFDSDHCKVRFKKTILVEKSNLNKYELIQFTPSYIRTDRDVNMTEKGLETFLGEEKDIFFGGGIKSEDKELQYPDQIPQKQLFYNKKERKQLEELKNLLHNDNYKSIKMRLKEHSMSSALTILFHGFPGTGKTETVMQIARETGRPLYMIDVSKFKTCWFGESEKNLKRLFDKYRKKVETSDIEPILLFNEADAIFGKRQDVNSSNVAQTENAIQNIILQEMETLDGILIATTNLTQNFDEAFERRFLYKIFFEKPEVEVALQIWKSRFTEMDENNLRYLVEKFPFTGGQIENIARKYKMACILDGKTPDIIQLEQYCKDENLTNKFQRKTLGFCIN
ncbi:MAG: ATP-binding protein [Bacteroidetes bacterium]|nr:ATP-binding protein [Bacteroidota bacterium]